MNNLQKTGAYLENQIKFNTKIALIFLVIGLVTLFFYVGIIFIGISIYFFTKRSHYKSGYSGEQRVIESLQKLPDSYYLINDVNLPNGYGNIDHVVLGSNGIFIIETKNFEGEIRCEGDNWYQYKDTWEIPEEYEIKSPSKQVKGNALKLKQYIESKNIFGKSLRLWVEGMVVFSHDNVILHCNNPTVPVFKVSQQLGNYIQNRESKIKFSSQELKNVAKILLRQV
ncbi:TPA: NERD domain-containing protein [Candidatus Woesearchaeota archaeon]|nr:NERD domain-containing protein [Candidatus Woesearchaeota archaeon]HIG93737.1 NERD domain-containing protein [Candidatus Woesearchaeota archaeon]